MQTWEPKEAYPQLIEAVEAATSLEDLRAVCAQICTVFGFDFYFFGMILPTTLVEPDMVMLTNYPSAWVERYQANNYTSFDPVIQHCTTNSAPILWEEIHPFEKRDLKVRKFMNDARSFGLRAGMSCSVNSPSGVFSIFSLACQNPESVSPALALQVSPS